MIYVSDMSRCEPASALSQQQEKGHWTLIPYETEEVSGTMVSAFSYINAPELTLPLGVSGWHAVYIGYWNPYYVYDEGTTVKFRLSGDAAFCRVSEPLFWVSQTETAIQEAFFKYADLTGQDFVIGKVNGARAKKAMVAYIRLVPLQPEQVSAIQEDRARTDTRKLVATIDGVSYLSADEYKTKEHILEQVEYFRHSDVSKVLWAVNYGDLTNYPSDVATFLPEHSRASLVEGAGTTSYIQGEKATYDTFLDLISSKGIIPQEVVADHVHEMGLKFDIMFRLGIGGGLPPHRKEHGMVDRHPEFRQVLRDGTLVEKASYAFAEVRAFMHSVIREATSRFDVDGINLCFVRGPRFVAYEQPVLDDFQREYGEDAREVDPSDPRLHAVHARYMSDFVRGARRILDEIGQAKGKRLELSVWVWPNEHDMWCGDTPAAEGLDFRGWIEEGLLDSVICENGLNEEDLAWCKKHGCEFILFPGYRDPTPTTPKTIAEGYQKGVDGIAIWDIDLNWSDPGKWGWQRRAGHQDEMASWEESTQIQAFEDTRQMTEMALGLPSEATWIQASARRIPLLTVGGYNAAEGLQVSVYSGG